MHKYGTKRNVKHIIYASRIQRGRERKIIAKTLTNWLITTHTNKWAGNQSLEKLAEHKSKIRNHPFLILFNLPNQ